MHQRMCVYIKKLGGGPPLVCRDRHGLLETPEGGGPAKFAKTFSSWISPKVESVKVLSTTPNSSQIFEYSNIEVYLQSRKKNIFFRFFSTVLKLGKISSKNSIIVSNGCFLETYISSLIFRFNYAAKVPGDIVWERAINNKSTSLSMVEYQLATLPIRMRILRFLFSRSLMRADVVIVPSTVMRKVCLGWGIPKEKIVFIPNSVDSIKFRPRTKSVMSYDVITVSRLITIKRIEEIIRVCRKYDLSLLVVGDGPEDGNLREYAKQSGGEVHFFGNASQEQLPDLYLKSKYFILNSEFEAGTPYALLEARACGLVCVANKLTGCSDVISDGVDGYLFDGNSSNGLEKKLRQALSEKGKYNKFSRLLFLLSISS
jgi:glycosyltransferase involved in cell wall biosynthesis